MSCCVLSCCGCKLWSSRGVCWTGVIGKLITLSSASVWAVYVVWLQVSEVWSSCSACRTGVIGKLFTLSSASVWAVYVVWLQVSKVWSSRGACLTGVIGKLYTLSLASATSATNEPSTTLCIRQSLRCHVVLVKTELGLYAVSLLMLTALFQRPYLQPWCAQCL